MSSLKETELPRLINSGRETPTRLLDEKNDHYAGDEFSLESISEELKMERQYVLDVTSKQRHLELADFGKMEGQKHGKFGEVLFGVEAVQEKIAFTADARHACFKNNSSLKEDFVVQLLCGLGTGRSTMLESHLKTLQNGCSDPDLKNLLNNHPLVLNVTYDSSMSFNALESTELALVCLARRMISSYFDIPWYDVSTLKLSSKPDVVVRTMELLVTHHKNQCQLHDSAQIAVILNVDDISAIPRTLEPEEATKHVGGIAKALRDLSMSGVSNRCPVIPIVAGSRQLQFIKAAEYSGVRPMVHNLPVLSDSDMYKALRACDVDEQYLNNPDFIRLLDDTGGVPRLVRIVLEGITEKYDASRIPIAHVKVGSYVVSKVSTLPLNVLQALLPVVLMGQTVSINTPVSDVPLITYDDLQRLGYVWLNKSNKDPNAYNVIVPMLFLKNYCRQYSLIYEEMRRVDHMLSLLKHRDWDHFVEFIGHYHSFLNRTLALTRPSVSLGDFYKGVVMHPDVATIELKLDANKNYEALSRRSGKDEHRFPLIKSYIFDTQKKEEAARLTSELLDGKVVVNSHGSAIDVIQVDPLTSGGVLVRALCVFHTKGEAALDKDKVDEDRKKAILAVKGCQQLVTAIGGIKPKNGTLPKCVTVHITNGTVADDVDCKSSHSIVIGRHNMEAFFGPVLSRGMMSRAGVVNGKMGKVGFCTLRRLSTMQPSRPMCIGVQSLTLVSSMMFK